MPVEIRELVIKATIGVDWENKTINDSSAKSGCPQLPTPEEIAAFVNEYFRDRNAKSLTFDQRQLSTFLREWLALFPSTP